MGMSIEFANELGEYLSLVRKKVDEAIEKGEGGIYALACKEELKSLTTRHALYLKKELNKLKEKSADKTSDLYDSNDMSGACGTNER